MKFEISLKRLVDVVMDEFSTGKLSRVLGISLLELYSFGSGGIREHQEPTEEIANAVRKFLEDE